MRKLGLVGRWQEFPASGISIDGRGVREVEIRFNTMERTIVYVVEPETVAEVLQGDSPRGDGTTKASVKRAGKKTLLGVVDGLEAFNFRANLPCRVEVVQEGEKASSVFYDTEAGRNFTIDGEHLRDFTVPMIGRRDRNPELEAVQFAVKQQLREMGSMMNEFLAFKRQMMEAEHGKGDETNVNANPKPRKGGKPAANPEPAGAGSSADGDTGREIPDEPEIQAAAGEGDPGGSPSETP